MPGRSPVMQQCRYAIRLPDGSVRGLVGEGPDRHAAYLDFLVRSARAFEGVAEEPDHRAIVWDVAELPAGERAVVEADWLTAAR